jgi:hypothetical protein
MFTDVIARGWFSCAHQPRLRVKPGITLITDTIDAGGVDSKVDRSCCFDERDAMEYDTSNVVDAE